MVSFRISLNAVVIFLCLAKIHDTVPLNYTIVKLRCRHFISLHHILFRHQAHTVSLRFEQGTDPPIRMRLLVNVNEITALESQLVRITSVTIPQGLINVGVIYFVSFIF